MRNRKVSTGFKRMLSLFVVLCMALALVPATLVSADSADAKNAIIELNNLLDDESKRDTIIEIVDEAWIFVKDSMADPNPTTVEDVFVRVQARLAQLGKSNLITADGSNGTIAESSVKLLIQKLLDKKQTIATQINLLKGKGLLTKAKELFGNAQSEGELMINFLTTLKAKQLKLITMEGNQFKVYSPNGDSLDKLLANAFKDEIGDDKSFDVVFQTASLFYTFYITDLNEKIKDNSINPQDIIDVLNLYGLYRAPATNPGGGGYIPVPTPEPTPVPTPNPILPGAVEEIEKISDPGQALDKAVEIITDAADLIANAEKAGKSTSEITEAMLEVAEKVMEKLNVQTVKATETADGAKASISETEAAKIAADLDKIVEAAKKLNDALEKVGADTKVEAALNIKVEADSKATAVQVELPASLLNAASESKIKKIVIDTGISTLVAAPDAVKAEEAKTVVFTARKLDADKLPENVKKAVGENTVYDYQLTVDGKLVEKFGKPVEVIIPYTLKKGENAKKVTVFYINDKGELENVIGKYDEASGSVTFKTKHFSGYVAKVNEVTFSDLESVEWARENIEVMASKAILNGKGNGKYDPEANITRAEFAAMMVRTFKLQDSEAKNIFTDVDEDDWYLSEVASAVSAGLIQGRGDGTFAPEENISREDMTVMMARALNTVKAKENTKSPENYIAKFKDRDDISSYAKDSVAMAVKYGLINGVTKDTFVPANEATRAEAAAIMFRIFFLK